ncbi:MAG: hypothetical protein H6608_03285 [Flavobacteriales bacterium]|nr:hypothetical protein [Bacteroidota bacterium]MCB9240128.1 hypothetical protein [Flavobacteriales bacterium]
MNKLIESGLFGNRLVPVDTPLMVDRYNATLTDIGLPNTRLTAFHIDGWGWSPQIADELGDQFYLSHGLANPYGIIITPEQKEASIYMPYHSFDWDIHQRIFQEYERQISDITTQCGIWFEVDQDVTAYRSPQDLLMVDVFKVRFTTVDRVLEAAREQRALINRFNEEQKAWMDESLRDAIIQSSEQHGDLRFRSIELSDIPFGRYGNFHTLAFNGLYVLRSLPSGKSVLVFADKEAMAKADGEGRSAWDAYHLEDPRLMSVLMAEGLISSNIGYYKDKQFLIHILTGTILRQAIRDDIQHINLPDDPRSRDRVIQGLALKSGKLPDVYFDLERLEKELSRGANPTAGGTLNEKLIHPAESLSAQDKIVIWHLLSNTVLDHVLINYLFDKSGFFRSFSERNETEQDWVVQVILEHRDKFNQIIG